MLCIKLPRQDASALFGNAPDACLELIDTPASVAKYHELWVSRVQAHYPTASVEISDTARHTFAYEDTDTHDTDQEYSYLQQIADQAHDIGECAYDDQDTWLVGMVG